MLDPSRTAATVPALDTERLTLRAITEDDAAALYELWRDPEVARYLPRAAMTAPGEALERIRKLNTLYQEGYVWAITHRGGGAVIGTCVLFHFVKQHFRAELGYELARAWWGRGLVTEAASAVVNFAFNSLGLHSLEAHIDPENGASRRVLEKLGFVQEGYFRESYFDARISRFTDTAVFSLLQPNWIKRDSTPHRTSIKD